MINEMHTRREILSVNLCSMCDCPNCSLIMDKEFMAKEWSKVEGEYLEREENYSDFCCDMEMKYPCEGENQ